MSSDPEHIRISARAYSFIKQMAIRNVGDALVELLTNVDDAYDCCPEAPAQRDIEIEAIPQFEGAPQRLIVRDHAIGLTGENMVLKFLQVGEYTSNENARGYFSRGAKDITALGDVIFETIRDNKYSKVGISRDSIAARYVLDMDVTDELRASLQMPNGNGLQVTLFLLPQFYISDPLAQLNRVRMNFALRDIFSNPSNNITFTLRAPGGTGQIAYQTRIAYAFPKYEEVVFNRTYTVPGYEHVSATFTLYRCAQRLPETPVQGELEFGVLVQSGKVLHDLTFFKPYLRHHVATPFLYGRLRCDYINELMRSIEVDGRSDKNPFTVLDPSRRYGINVDHPFVRQLYSVPGLWMDMYVKQFASSMSIREISSKNMRDLIQNLEVFTSELIQSNETISSWLARDKVEADMVRALINVDRNYVQVNPIGIEVQSLHPPTTAADNYDATLREFIFDWPKTEVMKILGIKDFGTLRPMTGDSERDLPPETDLIAKAVKQRPAFSIRFTDQQNPPYRYNIYKSNSEIVMAIHLLDDFVAQYFSVNAETGHIDVLSERNAVVLADMLTEALARLLVDLEVGEGKVTFDLTSSAQVASDVFRHYETKVRDIDQTVSAAVQHWLDSHEDLNDGIDTNLQNLTQE
jgi:hypothetical protein